jgi:H+-transporting ATPase
MDTPNTPSTNPTRAPEADVVQTTQMETTETKSVLIAQEKMSSIADPDPDEDGREESIDDLIQEIKYLDGVHATRSNRKSMESAKHSHLGTELEFDTDLTTGLTEEEVAARRKQYGPNQLKEEKENLYLKFLSFFVGPVQFVMEVSDTGRSTRIPPTF